MIPLSLRSLVGQSNARRIADRRRRRSQVQSTLAQRVTRTFRSELLETRSLLAIDFQAGTVSGEWIEQGPAGVTGAQTEHIDLDANGTSYRNPIVGAVQQLATFNGGGGKTGAYAATVSGGIWKTSNISDPNPNWSVMSDTNLKIKSFASIAVSPHNSLHVLAGSGDVTNGGNIGVPNGVFHSRDGGNSWSQVSLNITDIELSPLGKPVYAGLQYPQVSRTVLYPRSLQGTVNDTGQMAMAATTQGLVIHKNILNTTLEWKRLSGYGGLAKGPTTDVVEVLSNTSATAISHSFYAGVRNEGIFYSSTVGTSTSTPTWTKLNFTGACGAVDLKKVENIRFATKGTGDTHTLYAGLVVNNGTEAIPLNITYVFKITNNGSNCTSLGTPATVNLVEGRSYFQYLNAGNQGRLNFSIAVHPSQDDMVFVGGDRQEVTGGIEGNTESSVGRLFYYDKSVAKWKTLTSETSAVVKSFPHADSRSMTFVTDNTGQFLLETNDGGIYHLSNPDHPSRLWTSRMGSFGGVGRTINAAEVYSVSYNRTFGTYTASLQDNGTVTSLLNGSTTSPWLHSMAGDGSVTAYAQYPDHFAEFRIGNNFDSTLVMSKEATAVAMDVGVMKVANLGRQDKKDTADTKFFHIELAPNAARKKTIALGASSLYESEDEGDTLHTIALHKPDGSERVTGLAYGSKAEPSVVYAGYGNRIGVRGPQPMSATGSFTLGKPLERSAALDNIINDIVINPDDWRVAYVVTFSSIWRTLDGGVTWKDITSTLTDQTQTMFQTVEIFNPTSSPDDEILLVGGFGGVVASNNPRTDSPEWATVGSKLPWIQVMDLHSDIDINGKEFLYVGTWGRGVWKLDNPRTALRNVMTITGDGTLGNNNDAVTIRRHETLNDLITITINGQHHGDFAIDTIAGIKVRTGEGSDVLTIDNSKGIIGRFSVESPLTPFIEFLDVGNAVDSDQLNVTGLSGNVKGQSYSGIGSAQDRNAVTVTDSTKRISTTIHYAGIETPPSVTQGALPADAVRRAFTSIDQATRKTTAPSKAAINLTKSIRGTKIVPKSAKPLNGSGGKSKPKATLAADFRSAITAKGFFEDFFIKSDGRSLLDDLGVTVKTATEMAAAFDLLDDIPNNVTFVDKGDGSVVWDVQVEKVLEGDTHLEAKFLNGLAQFDAALTIKGTARAHFQFGVDSQGFYLLTDALTDANEKGAPEITFSQLSGSARGLAQLGFAELQIHSSPVVFEPGLTLTLDFHDLGVGTNADGKLRLQELSADVLADLVTADVVRNTNATQPDIELQGNFSLAGLDIPLLQNTLLDIRWPNIEDLSQGTIIPHALGDSRAARVMEFLSIQGESIVAATRDLATHLQAVTDQPTFVDKEIPIVNKTIGELLNAVDNSFTLSSDDIVGVSPLVVDGQHFEFDVIVNDSINLLQLGIAPRQVGREGGTIRYLSNGVLVDADIQQVDPHRLTVQFSVDDAKTPDAVNPLWALPRPGSIFDRINALAQGFEFNIPTLQELIRRLGHITGIDVVSGVQVISHDPSGGLADAYLQIPFDFALDPLEFEQNLDLSNRIRQLKLSGGAAFDLSVTPTFHLPIGIRLAPNLSIGERFFLPEDEQPEIQLDLAASMLPNITGSIGFLDVSLRPKPGVTNNQGIVLTTQLSVNLQDPGQATADDGEIRFTELAQNLSSAIDIDVTGSLDIDGLQLSANLGGQNTLAALTLALDGESENGPGRIDSLDDFGRLLGPQGIVVTGELASFESFANIGPEQIFQALQFLVEQLHAMGRGGAFDRPLPLINRSLSDLIDLGEAWASTIGQPSSATSIATARGLQDFLQARLGNTGVLVTVRAGEIVFDFRFSKEFSHNQELAFAVGNSGISLVGNSTLAISACADVNVSLGVTTEPDVQFAQRVFLNTSRPDEISLRVLANVGYQNAVSSACGVVNVPQPMNLTATVGPLALQVSQGRALIDVGVIGNLGVGAVNERLTLANLETATLTPAFNGSVQAILPLDGNGGGVAVLPHQLNPQDALVAVGGSFTNLASLTTDIFSFDLTTSSTPQANDLPHHTNPAIPLSAAEISALGANRIRIVAHNVNGMVQQNFLNFGTLITGLERLIDRLDQLLGTDALDAKIPFVGKSLRDGLNFLESDRPGAQTLRSIITTLIADASSGLQANSSTAAVREAIGLLREALRRIPGIRAVKDADGDGTIENATSITNGKTVLASGDDLVQVNENAQGIQGVTFYFRFTPNFDVTLPFDLGLDFLKFQADASGQVTFDGELDLQLGFGIDRTLGFFLDTSLAGPEFALSGRIQPDATLSAKLGILNVSALLSPSTNYMTTRFSMDLDDGPNTDGKLTLAELANFANVETYLPSVGRKLEVEAHLQAVITTSLVAPGQGSSCAATPQGSSSSDDNLFPELSGRLVVDWAGPVNSTTTAFDPNSADGKPFDLLHMTTPVIPSLALRDVQLDMGSFLDDLIAPLLRRIQSANLLPIDVIDFLNRDLPLVQKTPRELLTASLTEEQSRIVNFILDIGQLIHDTETLDSEGLRILFGDITIAQDLSAPNQVAPSPALTDATIGTNKGAPTGEKDSSGDTPLKIPGSGLPVVGSFLERLGNLGIFFPVLRLSNLANLLVGRDVDLVFIDAPELELGADFDVNVPLAGIDFSPLFAVAATLNISGGFEFQVNLSGGLDTSGLRSGHFLDGFYLGDFDPGNDGQIQPTDLDRPEVSLTGFVQAAVQGTASVLEFDIAKISGFFRIEAGIHVDLNDDNERNGAAPSCDTRSPEKRHDGKLHGSEAAMIAASHGGRPLSVLDIGGSVDGELGLHVTVLNGLLFDRTYSFPIPIASFDLSFPVECPPDPNEPPAPNSGPADLDPDGFTLDVSVSDSGPLDVDDITATTMNTNGDLFDGQTVAGFDPNELLMEQFGEEMQFQANDSNVDLSESNIQSGMGVEWVENGVTVQGMVTQVTSTGFRATRLSNTGGRTVNARAVNALPQTSAVVVNSGRETLVVQSNGYVQRFGPEECGPGYVPVLDHIREINASLGVGNDLVRIDSAVTTPVRVDAGPGRDVVKGGSGPLTAFGGPGNDILQAGDRTLKPGKTSATVSGSELRGDEGDDYIRGGLGSDRVVGGEGDDDLRDAPDSDESSPYRHASDQVVGGGGKDELLSDGGDDLLVGDYDAVLDERPQTNENQKEDSDHIKQRTSGRATIFGDNHGVGLDEPGPQPQATRIVDDRVTAVDPATRVFADAGDKISSSATGGIVKLSAGGRSVRIAPSEIELEGLRPISYGPGVTIYVVDHGGVITAYGSDDTDQLHIVHSPDGLQLTWNDSGHVIVGEAQRLIVQSGGGDDTLVVDSSQGDLLLSEGLEYYGGKPAKFGDTVRIVGDERNTIVGHEATGASESSVFELTNTLVTLIETPKIELTQFGVVRWSTAEGNDALTIEGAKNDAGVIQTHLVNQPSQGSRTVVVFSHVTEISVDLGLADTVRGPNADQVRILDGAFQADGLAQFDLRLGDGDDQVQIATAEVGIPNRGILRVDGGTGVDRIDATADTDWTLTSTDLATPSNTMQLVNFDRELVTLTGGASANRFVVTNWSGSVALNGAAGVDSVQLALNGGTVSTTEMLSLIGNVVVSASANLSVLRGSLDLGTSPHTFQVADGSAAVDLQLEATLNGSGTVTKTGTGTLLVGGTQRGTGLMDITAGTVRYDANNSLQRIQFRSGARFGGQGVVGAVSSSGGQFSPGDLGGPGRITTGSLQLDSATTASYDLNGPFAGTNYDTISVVGAVSLFGPLTTSVNFTPTVGSTYTLIDNDGTDAVRGTFLNLAEGTTFTSGLATFRISYRGGTGNDVVLTHIQNAAPKFPNRSISTPIREGELATLVGDISEPDRGDIFVLEVRWGDGSAQETHIFAPGTPQATLRHRFEDDPSADGSNYLVELLWRDQHGAFNVGTLPVVVENVAPTIEPVVNTSITPGIYFTSGQFADPGRDVWVGRVDYGDGGGWESLALNGRQFTLAHTYSLPGLYPVQIEIADDDGGVGALRWDVSVKRVDGRLPGDIDGDQIFGTSDLVAALVAGKYESGRFASFDEGDWNGDGVFDSSDLVVAWVSSPYERGIAARSEPAPTKSPSLFEQAWAVADQDLDEDSLSLDEKLVLDANLAPPSLAAIDRFFGDH